MAAYPTTDPFYQAGPSLESPARIGVALTYAMISDTVDLSIPAKSVWIYNGSASAVTLNMVPVGNADDAPLPHTVPAGANMVIPCSARRIKSTGSTNLTSGGAIIAGIQVNLYTA